MKELAKKSYVDKVYTVQNANYTNLHAACIEFEIERGVFIIIAEGATNHQSVVIANWDRNYYSKYPPNIIHKYNNGFSYSESNNTGTIAFDITCNSITVKLLAKY